MDIAMLIYAFAQKVLHQPNLDPLPFSNEGFGFFNCAIYTR
jgi:hypothetical protein